eukprot:Mrub_10639.p1 GENE.Mrub_10639~~Mrub_10639.p1  ORF type:complete len:212 (-),score=41.51 Mrub_10639:34-618(-)
MLQLTENSFKSDHDLTIGVEFGTTYITVDNKINKIQIWDTAGQESFKSITRGYYRGSTCAVLVYDITRRDTFKNVVKWLDEARKACHEQLVVALVGNKLDMEGRRVVETKEGKEFAEKHGLIFYETSAKSGKYVKEVFEKTVCKINTNISNNVYDLNEKNIHGIKLGPLENDNTNNKTNKLNDRNKKKNNDNCC